MQLKWRTGKRPLSPYLKDPNRLGDVIAAIQAMGTYKFYKLTHEGWADRIAADRTQAETWKAIFLEHPEFFRLDSARKKASLVRRRQFPKLYNVDTGQVISKDHYDRLSGTQKLRLSRVPLSSGDIKALVDTAVNLHSRALEYQKEKRWWAALSGGVGGLLGAIIGGLLK